MNKKILLVGVALFAGFALTANAQIASTTAVKPAATTKGATSSKPLPLAISRLYAAIDRVQTLADRTKSRIDKLTAQQIDERISLKYLADARLKLDEARAKVAIAKAAQSSIADVGGRPANSTAMKNAQSFITDATKLISDAERLVTRAVSNIKPGQNKPAATTPKAKTTMTR